LKVLPIVAVEIDSKRYALKVMRYRGAEVATQSLDTPYQWLPIVIQDTLGRLPTPAAPILYGLMTRSSLIAWAQDNQTELAKYGVSDPFKLKYAMLMEFCQSPSDKVDLDLYDKVDLRRIQELHDTLAALGVIEGDSDLIFNSAVQAVFVDFGYYKLK